jgi:hypothetical protein
MQAPRAVLRLLIVALAALSHLGCADSATGVGARQPPYLAVVVFVEAPPEVTTRGPFTFRVRELSGQLGVDTSFRATPSDTTILSVVAASYRIDIAGVPETCAVRNGTAQATVVPPNTNTTLVRFFINCEAGLTVITGTDGATADPDYLVSVTSAATAARSSVVKSNDTVRFADLPGGTYDVTLRLIADNCVVTSDGGSTARVSIVPRGNAAVRFRIVCAEPARRPRITRLVASYFQGSLAYVVRATDPDGDITRSFVDVTDCNLRSVLPTGGQRRGGFSSQPNVGRRDTAVIIGAYDLTLTDAQLANRCLAVWVDDERGNVSPFVEIPLPPRAASRAPVVSSFNALLDGTRSVIVSASATDPNTDYVGAFLVYLVRDGVLSTPDGQPDRVVSQPAGIIGPVATQLLVGIGFGAWNDYLGAIMYFVDAEGNFTRALDLDLFR